MTEGGAVLEMKIPALPWIIWRILCSGGGSMEWYLRKGFLGCWKWRWKVGIRWQREWGRLGDLVTKSRECKDSWSLPVLTLLWKPNPSSSAGNRCYWKKVCSAVSRPKKEFSRHGWGRGLWCQDPAYTVAGGGLRPYQDGGAYGTGKSWFRLCPASEVEAGLP